MNLAKYLEVWFTLYCTNTEQLKQRKASISLQMRTKNEQTYIANTQWPESSNFVQKLSSLSFLNIILYANFWLQMTKIRE